MLDYPYWENFFSVSLSYNRLANLFNYFVKLTTKVLTFGLLIIFGNLMAIFKLPLSQSIHDNGVAVKKLIFGIRDGNLYVSLFKIEFEKAFNMVDCKFLDETIQE